MVKNKLIYIRVLVASFVGLLLLSYLLLLLPIVQEKIGQRIATNLSKSLGTEFKLEGLSFSLLNRVDIKNVLIRDQQKDTLLFAQTLKTEKTIANKIPFYSHQAVCKYSRATKMTMKCAIDARSQPH